MLQLIRIEIDNPESAPEFQHCVHYHNVSEIASVVSYEIGGDTMLDVTFRNNDHITLAVKDNPDFYRWVIDRAAFKFRLDGSPFRRIAQPDNK